MKKSIAFVLPSLNAGGAQRVVSSLANLLIEEYHIVIIVLYKCESFYPLDSKITIDYCLPTYNPNPKFTDAFTNNYKLVKQLYKKLKAHNIHLAIGFLPATNIYTILASKRLGIPCIISERANPEYNKINTFWQTVRKLIYPLSNRLVVQTIGNKNYFKSYSKSEIEIIKNPLNTELLDKRDQSIPKENLIINVGRLIGLKNQDLLIRAFSNIKNKGWKLVFLGEGDKKEEYKNLIRSLKIEDQITLAGNVTDVSTYYNKAKIFVFTSKHEGFPNVITEAMSYGLACISTDCPYGPSEIITHGKNGSLIPVGDQTALETSLQQLINNEALRNTYGNHAKKSIEAYAPTRIAVTWSKLIQSLLNNNK